MKNSICPMSFLYFCAWLFQNHPKSFIIFIIVIMHYVNGVPESPEQRLNELLHSSVYNKSESCLEHWLERRPWLTAWVSSDQEYCVSTLSGT